jgi:hypothetical protein
LEGSLSNEAYERYQHALGVYLLAKAELEETLRDLQNEGEFPPHPGGVRFRLPEERSGHTKRFAVGVDSDRIEGCLTANAFPSGELGEVFITAEKQGTFVSGLLDGFATTFSIALQYGAPLDRLIEKFRYSRFEPAGYTGDNEVRVVTSVLDYLMQWLELKKGVGNPIRD